MHDWQAASCMRAVRLSRKSGNRLLLCTRTWQICGVQFVRVEASRFDSVYSMSASAVEQITSFDSFVILIRLFSLSFIEQFEELNPLPGTGGGIISARPEHALSTSLVLGESRRINQSPSCALRWLCPLWLPLAA